MIYLFRCPSHGEFEVRQGMEEEHKAVCPECKAQGQRIYTPLGFYFNGLGFWGWGDRLKDGTKVENGLGDDFIHNF